VQLRSVIVTAPEGLRAELRRLPPGQLIRRCSRLRRSSSRTPDELAIVLALRSLARRVEAASEEANELEREIVGHVRALVPQLLEESGVGPIVAAQLIVTWSHRGRVRSEAAFARLAGVAPLPPRAARRSGIASVAAATASSTARSTPSSFTAVNTTRRPGTTSLAASPKARAHGRRPASSSATSPATSTASCRTQRR
jgi:transposase